jgi:hypothetical protein
VTGGAEKKSPTSEPIKGSSRGGLSSGEKAGIGVGVSIGGLLLALRAFFLGMSVRKKSRVAADTEFVDYTGKPELKSKTVYREKTTQELDIEITPVEARETGDTFKTVLKTDELAAQPFQVVPAAHTELAAEPRRAEMESSEVRQLPHELQGNTAKSPVPPVSNDQCSGLARSDTYDDPTLVENLWA